VWQIFYTNYDLTPFFFVAKTVEKLYLSQIHLEVLEFIKKYGKK